MEKEEKKKTMEVGKEKEIRDKEQNEIVEELKDFNEEKKEKKGETENVNDTELNLNKNKIKRRRQPSNSSSSLDNSNKKKISFNSSDFESDHIIKRTKSFESLSSIKNDRSYFSSENTSFSPSYESEEIRENELLNTMKNIEKGKKYKYIINILLNIRQYGKRKPKTKGNYKIFNWQKSKNTEEKK